MGAVAKYCNKHVYVCLSASISPEPHARSLANFLCMLPIALAQSSSSGVTKSQGKGAIYWVFLPLDNALYGLHSGMNFATKDQLGLIYLFTVQLDRIQFLNIRWHTSD